VPPSSRRRVRLARRLWPSAVCSEPVCTIRNAAPADFADVAAPPAGAAFRIVHTGSLHTALGQSLRASRTRRRLLGGTAPGLDILPRSPVFLVEAIAADPELAGAVELHLAGELTAADERAVAGHPFVRPRGVLTHRAAIALMRSADLLFLPMHDLPAGQRAGLIPYKTYEYLAAGRPILAAVPDGDVRDMLAGLEHVSLVRPADVGGMAAAVRRRRAAGRAADAQPPAVYDRGRSVARIAAVLDAVVAPIRTAPRTSRSVR